MVTPAQLAMAIIEERQEIVEIFLSWLDTDEVYMCIFMYIRIHTYIHTYIYTYTCICVYICIDDSHR